MPTDDTQRHEHEHKPCCSLPEHITAHAMLELVQSTLLILEKLDAMSTTLDSSFQTVDDKLVALGDDITALISAEILALKWTVAQQDVSPAAQKAIVAHIDSITAAVLAAMPSTGTGTGTTTPPALTGFTILLPGPVGSPDVFTVGKAFQIQVQANGSSGVLTGYLGTVNASAGPNQPDYTFVTSDAGVHEFNARFDSPGQHSITVTDNATGISGSVTVNVVAAGGTAIPPDIAPATHLTVALLPNHGPLTADVPTSFNVTAVRADGSIDTSYLGLVDLTGTNVQAASLPNTIQFIANDAGVHLVNHVVPAASGSISINASDGSISGAFTDTVA